jgi:hypothetical protein
MNPSLTEVITEHDFLELAQEHSKNFFKIYNFLHGEHKACTRKFYAYLFEESEELESFLDDHCARDNSTWYFFGELVACIRNVAKVAFILRHVLHRYPSYDLEDGEDDSLLGDVQGISKFFDKTIISLYEELKAESLRLGIKSPRGTLKEDFFREIYPQISGGMMERSI